jgi:hypothetical protein
MWGERTREPGNREVAIRGIGAIEDMRFLIFELGKGARILGFAPRTARGYARPTLIG